MSASGSNITFDANTVTPNARPEPLPVGDYRVAISESEVKPTSTGKGKMLKLKLVVLDDPYKGRIIFDQLNVQHESAEAQKIAQGQLSAICHATGILQLSNSSQLHNRPMLARVGIKRSAGYDPQNTIKGYKPIDGIVAGNVGASPAVAAAPVAAANAPAWAKKSA